MKTIGVLSLQGDFDAHRLALERAGAKTVFVRDAATLDRIDGLVVPGGESTTMIKLLKAFDLMDPIHSFYKAGKGLFGTCAGSILMANKIHDSSQFCFGFIDINIHRNGYGRQADSFEGDVSLSGIDGASFHAIFIRAPRILSCGPDVKVLSRHDGSAILAASGNVLVSTFHPEIGTDSRIHEYFLEQCVN